MNTKAQKMAALIESVAQFGLMASVLPRRHSVAIALVLATAALVYAPGALAVGTPTIGLTPPPGIGSLGGASLLTSSPSVSTAGGAAGAVSSVASGGTQVTSLAGTAVSGATTVAGNAAAGGLLPFGGKITLIEPNICGGFSHITVLTMFGTKHLMIDGAAKAHLFGPPSHPGQNILGVYSPTQVTCSPNRFTSISGGRVFMYGTSL